MNKIQTGYLVKFTYLAVIASIALPGFIIFQPGMPSGHDIISHVYRSKIFIDALKEGQFPVRWIDSAMSNFSGPLFNFYQVGFYYLVSLVDLATSSLYFSIKAIITFSWLLGALFMFLYAKRFGNLPGALAALVFAFTPYIKMLITRKLFGVPVSYPFSLICSRKVLEKRLKLTTELCRPETTCRPLDRAPKYHIPMKLRRVAPDKQNESGNHNKPKLREGS